MIKLLNWIKKIFTKDMVKTGSSKKELVYVYVLSFKGLQCLDINLSGDVLFSNEGNRLQGVTKKTSVPNGFFGENITSVSAIIGNNGSGKSSLLELILDIYSNSSSIASYFALFKDDEGYYAYNTPTCIPPDIKELDGNSFECSILQRTYLKGFAIFHTALFSSQNQTNSLLNNSYGYSNISNNYMLYRDSPEGFKLNIDNAYYTRSLGELYSDHNKKELYRFIEALTFLNKEYFPFQLPEELAIQFEPYEVYTTEDSTEIEKAFKDIFERLNLNEGGVLLHKEVHEYKLNLSYLYALHRHYETYLNVSDSKILGSDFDESIIRLSQLGTSEWDFTKSFNIIETRNISKEELKLFYQFKECYFAEYGKKFNGENQPSDNEPLQLKFDELHYESSKTLLKSYYQKGILNDYLSFQWVTSDGTDYIFSSGERVFISLFARLYDLISIDRSEIDKNKGVLLLLDEPDFALHPDWQKKFLNRLINFLKLTYSDFPSVQIIFASHSPILISDLPDNNVFYLDGKPFEKMGTFGANIHSLFHDSFQLQGSLIGKFAESKIDTLISYLSDKKVGLNSRKYGLTVKKAEDIISLIGEPVMKEALLNALEQKKQRYDN